MKKDKETEKTIAICSVKIPFLTGGAEILSHELLLQLKKRGFNADLIEIPFGWWPPEIIIPNLAAWRMIEFTKPDGKPVDLVVTTKFPSYLIRHPNKVCWLYHQMRELYETDLDAADFLSGGINDSRLREHLIKLDKTALEEHRDIYTISKNVSTRLQKYNGIHSNTLYPPPKHLGKYQNEDYGDYILTVGRLEKWKRTDLLLNALAVSGEDIKINIIGIGPEEQNLKKLSKELGIENNVNFAGKVTDDELIRYYAKAKAVFFAPKSEDYGFITIEAFISSRPVITTNDSGGPTEFVIDKENGFICQPNPKSVAQAISAIKKQNLKAMGTSGYDKVKDISWDNIIENLITKYL
ncbi:MAG: glycosyltransferase family 4 protein [Acidobacteria bacterium]|nr:glycosyltransferase family 4 protein [Acidobacteriota bacterium]